MTRTPRDYDAELKALQEKARKLKGQKTAQLGELVQVTGADALPVEALAGALLGLVETGKAEPDMVARWTERGQAFFRRGRAAKRWTGQKAGPAASEPASGHG